MIKTLIINLLINTFIHLKKKRFNTNIMSINKFKKKKRMIVIMIVLIVETFFECDAVSTGL